MVLVVTSNILDAVHRHSMGAYPEECCGVFVGTADGEEKEVEAAWKLANRAPEDQADRRYRIPPKVYLELEDKAAEEDREIVGIYHSHPDHPSEPSATDRRRAWPFLTYLIVSVVDGQSESLDCWMLDPDGQTFLKEELVVR